MLGANGLLLFSSNVYHSGSFVRDSMHMGAFNEDDILLFNISVRDTAQENVMNAHEETRLFLVVVNQPKNITTISTRQLII
jgi:hypothetical protein